MPCRSTAPRRASRRPVAAAALCALLAPLAAGAADTIEVREPWMRALPNHLPAAGYFTLVNPGEAAAELVGASSPACGSLMLHETKTEGGVGRMVMVARVEVPPHGKVSFAPGGYHLMCMQPTPLVAPGHSVKVTLRFQDGSRVSADFPVRNASGN